MSTIELLYEVQNLRTHQGWPKIAMANGRARMAGFCSQEGAGKISKIIMTAPPKETELV